MIHFIPQNLMLFLSMNNSYVFHDKRWNLMTIIRFKMKTLNSHSKILNESNLYLKYFVFLPKFLFIFVLIFFDFLFLKDLQFSHFEISRLFLFTFCDDLALINYVGLK